MLFSPTIKGFFVSAGFIMAIGAQNAFVLRQGINKNHVFATAFVCSVIDLILVSMGIFGLGEIINTHLNWVTTLRWLGVCFLFFYGCLSLKELQDKASIRNENSIQKKSLVATILSLLGVSLLNPHVYLDTVLLIGSIGSQYSNLYDKKLFIIGSCIASTIWFFSLCFGASYFSRFLTNPVVWKLFNLCIACIMFWMAGSLLLIEF